MQKDIQSKIKGMLYGLCIGDALAMPVHWYYNRLALQNDYGLITDYLPPRNPHPDSILWRSTYQATGPKGEILHDQARYWGKRGIHYHQFLKAGENTLNVRIGGLLIESLNQNSAYDETDFLKRYIDFMTSPHRHRDTYVEECHRNFFRNYAAGLAPNNCGVEEKHIGGLSAIIPIVAFYHNQPRTARDIALAHLKLTHPGIRMETAAALLIDVLLAVLSGERLHDTIVSLCEAQRNPLLGHPFTKLLKQPDEVVIGRHFSPACYVEDAVPAVIYLALKYHHDPERALIVNTNLGGDNAGRGAVLGALLGADGGIDSFPERWLTGLVQPWPELRVSPEPSTEK